MNETPRVDAQMENPGEKTVPIDFARQLEWELREAQSHLADANKGARINAMVNRELAEKNNQLRAEADKEHAKAVELSDKLIDCRAELELAVKCVEALRLLYPKHAAVSASLITYDQFKSRKGGEAE